jgi:hypothetical protein
MASEAPVDVVLTDIENDRISRYAVDIESGHTVEAPAAPCRELPVADKFRIEDDHLFFGSIRLTKAYDLLVQGKANGSDIAVVRYEYNSFANPWRILIALSGHPVQVSQIEIVVVKGDRLRSQTTLERRAAAYKWKAALCG